MSSKGLALVCTFLLFFLLAVHSRPFSSPYEDLDLETGAKLFEETIEGKRNINVKISDNGLEISTECAYTNAQKILIAVIAIMGVLSVIGCCVCCKSLCSEKNRPVGTNSIVYQSVSRPSILHTANFQPLEPIPEGRCIPVQDQPPPYSSTTEALVNGKRW